MVVFCFSAGGPRRPSKHGSVAPGEFGLAPDFPLFFGKGKPGGPTGRKICLARRGSPRRGAAWRAGWGGDLRGGAPRPSVFAPPPRLRLLPLSPPTPPPPFLVPPFVLLAPSCALSSLSGPFLLHAPGDRWGLGGPLPLIPGPPGAFGFFAPPPREAAPWSRGRGRGPVGGAGGSPPPCVGAAAGPARARPACVASREPRPEFGVVLGPRSSWPPLVAGRLDADGILFARLQPIDEHLAEVVAHGLADGRTVKLDDGLDALGALVGVAEDDAQATNALVQR